MSDQKTNSENNLVAGVISNRPKRGAVQLHLDRARDAAEELVEIPEEDIVDLAA